MNPGLELDEGPGLETILYVSLPCPNWLSLVISNAFRVVPRAAVRLCFAIVWIGVSVLGFAAASPYLVLLAPARRSIPYYTSNPP